uniref:Uncharacterized protein n=1 Tax=Lygus hesperus TaxID=30085 RepID=A0A0A9Y8D2_LYGHE
MDLFSELITTQYAFHGIIVGTVLLFALLVFVFGFKSAEEPPFDKLTDDRRAAGKKKKIKEKKAQTNGHATAIGDAGAGKRSEVKAPKKEEKKDAEKSPQKEKQKQEKKSPVKNMLKESKANKENNKGDSSNKKVKGKGKENVEVTNKNKKNKAVDEKPKDFDDGEWEQALSRKDKKNRKSTLEEIIPQKNGTKSKPKSKSTQRS